MRCSHCGQPLEDGTRRCTRCDADLSAKTRTRALLITLVYAFIAIAIVTFLTYMVLHWHEAQLWGR